jgi:hypothetical protein
MGGAWLATTADRGQDFLNSTPVGATMCDAIHIAGSELAELADSVSKLGRLPADQIERELNEAKVRIAEHLLLCMEKSGNAAHSFYEFEKWGAHFELYRMTCELEAHAQLQSPAP